MNNCILGIDHPVIGVRDMSAAREAYERLGFTIPARGSHIEWGTGNWCIMFPDDYLELRGIIDAEKYTHGLDGFLAEREGLMGLAFGTADADEGHRALGALGLDPAEPRALTRNFELPGGWLKPRFRMVFIPPEQAPGLMAPLLLEHMTPELIRRPEWLEHPNRVRAVRALTAVVEDLDATRSAYARLFGDEALSTREGVLVVATGRGGELRLSAPERVEALHGAVTLDPAPPAGYLAGMVLAVDDLDATRRCLDANAVAYTTAGRIVRVGPDQTCGAIIDFEG